LGCAGCAGRTSAGGDAEPKRDDCPGSCELGTSRCSENRRQIEICSSVVGGCPAFAASASCSDDNVCGSGVDVHCGNPEWAQWPVANSAADVARGAPRPTSYSWANDGTVKDNVTGLIWTVDTAPEALPENAAETCKALQDGWRLPTLIELLSIVDYGRSKPSIDASAFPGTLSNFYCTSTKMDDVSNAYFGVDFTTGMSSPMQGAYPFRCVR
jgi:hypothetical protein